MASEQDFVEQMMHMQPKYDNFVKRDIDHAKHRSDELYMIIRKITENNALGVMDDVIYTKLNNDYQVELREVTMSIARLEKQDQESSNKRKDYTGFLHLINQYNGTQTELRRDVLLSLVDKIVVHEPIGAKWAKTKTNKIEVYYKGVGCISPRIS